MKSVYRIILLIILISPFCQATHLKGGEILASHVSGQTYNIKVRMYTDVNAAAAGGMTTILVCMGDGNTKEFSKTASNAVPGSAGVVAMDFENRYTYSSPGTFQISASIDNRVGEMLNLPASGQTPGFIWTVINTQVSNSTPILPYLSFDAGVRQAFTVDLAPTGADQDSVTIRVHRLSKPSPGTCGVRMMDRSYLFPNEISSNGIFKVVPAKKQLVWEAPEVAGVYGFALVVDEWRDGIKISETYREGTITVTDRPGPTVEIPPYESSEYGNLITSAPHVKSPEISMAIEAYPVPTEDFVTVKAFSKKREIIKLQLVDLNGRILREIASKNPEILMQEEFDLRNVARGVYIIRATNNNDSVSQKVVR